MEVEGADGGRKGDGGERDNGGRWKLMEGVTIIEAGRSDAFESNSTYCLRNPTVNERSNMFCIDSNQINYTCVDDSTTPLFLDVVPASATKVISCPRPALDRRDEPLNIKFT
ncbi:hypothetical protein EVAR_28551_1 [Eumeta japonica]|uniref:Uncharacterized protein n=1 Tax=Eumeta variegata TaxID=151549 RepID=A0A4C1UWP8_EUMVA|nr:hypothetical protein EVAR_28551_1 [Eumeta japonica]